MIKPILAALIGHWRRNPLQLFTLLGGLALATALWSGVQAINAEARASYDAAAATLGEGQFDRLVARDGGTITQAQYIALRRAGWRVSPVIEGRIDDIRLIGLEPLTAPGALLSLDRFAGDEAAGFMTGQDQFLAHPDAAATLRAYGKVTIDPSLAAGTALADIGTAQSVLQRAGALDLLIVDPVQPLVQPPLAQVAPALTLQKAQGGSDVARLTDSFHLNLTAFGLLSFAVGIFIVHGAIGLAFEQRRGMMRTLRALGTPLRLLIAVICIELLTLALIAGAIGVALGYLIAALLLPDVAATLRGLYGAQVGGGLQLRPIWWATGMGVAVGGTALAGAGALFKLSRMPLLAAGQARALAVAAGRGAQLQAWAALALLGLAGILAFTAKGIIAGFALLAALLIGAALALPIILRVVLRFAEGRASGVVAGWFWADTRQQLPGLSLALMALLLAMAANVGVTTMVSSFRLTFLAFLDQRLVAEVYVDAETAGDAAALIAFATPRSDAILPVQSAQITVAGQPVEIYGNRDHSTYDDNWRLLQTADRPWAQVAQGTGIVINEQLARRAELSIGDVIAVGARRFDVVGVYGDYGNPIGQAVINEAPFGALFPDARPVRFGLRMAAADVPDFTRDLVATTPIRDAQVINQAGIKAYSLGIFDRTFTVTTALNILTLSVAGFAILMSLLTLAAMRVPQLAPAWAMGMTRRKLGLLELLRALMLAVLTAVIALPLGLALAWVLLAVVNVAAFGWRLPMYLFPLDYLRMGLFALIAAALAAIWPALRLARTPPSALLKVFSNER